VTRTLRASARATARALRGLSPPALRAQAWLVLAWFALVACAPGGPTEKKPAVPPSPAVAYRSDPAALARGKALFGGTCTGYCHSVEPGGKGAPDLFDCDWLHGGSDAEIFHTLTTGVPDTRMVSFAGKLSDDDLWKIIAYLRSASRCQR